MATGNYHEFEIKSYVNDGEINTENNGYAKEEIFDSVVDDCGNIIH